MRFALDQAQFSKFRKALLARTIPLLLLPIIATLVFNRPDGTTTLFLIPLFLGIVVFVIRNLIKKQKKAWESFELIIDDFKVERNQDGFPSISVSKTDIKEALEAKNGSITLVTKPSSNSIIIPFSVLKKGELVEAISTFTTLREAKNNNGLLLSYVGAVLGLALFFSLMLSTNFYLTIASGLILFTLCLWGFIESQRNKNIDKKVIDSNSIKTIYRIESILWLTKPSLNGAVVVRILSWPLEAHRSLFDMPFGTCRNTDKNGSVTQVCQTCHYSRRLSHPANFHSSASDFSLTTCVINRLHYICNRLITCLYEKRRFSGHRRSGKKRHH